MSRVEWAAREGGEVETVLANLLYNWNRRAQRIRPTQGDFGIDVIIPSTEAADPWDVYQVKKYAASLTASQRSKVVESLARLLIGIGREALPVNNWHLVMPLDPTLPDRQEWFVALPQAAIARAKKFKGNPLTDAEELKAREWLHAPGRQLTWEGLPFCETLVGDYPRVVDYYLHDGSERLRDAVRDMTALIGGDMRAREGSTASAGEGSAALMEPAEILSTFAKIDEVLDTDPHYHYGLSIHPGAEPPELAYEPDLVAAHQRSLRNGRWLTFRIYQRSAQSLEERPIPFQVRFKFEDGTPDHAAFTAWQRYGKPFEAEAEFSIDLPGGLGTEGSMGTVTVPPPHSSSGYKLRLRVVGVGGNVLAELPFEMTSTVAKDGMGSWVRGSDPSRVLTHEGYFDISSPDATQRLHFSLAPLAGTVAVEVGPAVSFARHLEAPNTLQVAAAVGPFGDFVRMEDAEAIVPPAIDRFVAALATIQAHTSQVIYVPDVAELSSADRRQILRAAELLEGGVRVAKWDGTAVKGVDPSRIAVGGHYQLQLEIPLRVDIKDIKLELGGIEQVVLSAVAERLDGDVAHLRPHLNDTVHERFITAADRADAPQGNTVVRSRPYPESATHEDHEAGGSSTTA